MRKPSGFTLIEVLLALAIMAIAVTALLKTSAETISLTRRIKEINLSYWVASQGIIMVQTGLLPLKLQEETSQVTNMLGQRWFWRAKLTATPIKHVQQITITVSSKATGPFTSPLIGYRYEI